MKKIDIVIELYKYAAATGKSVLVAEKPKELSTEFSLDGCSVKVGLNSFRDYYERKLGLFKKHYKDRVESGSNGWDAVTTTVEELGEYRGWSNKCITLAFKKDIQEAIRAGLAIKEESSKMYLDGYSYCRPFPNMIPYSGGKFKVTFTGGDTLDLFCHLQFGSTVHFVRLDNGVNFDSQLQDLAHVEVIG
jgi:hypothetical protein